MILPKDFLDSLLNRVETIINDGEILSDAKDATELVEIFTSAIKKRDNCRINDFLIELEASLAFLFASRQLSDWMVEDRFDLMLTKLSKRVDRNIRTEITKLRYNEKFIDEKSVIVEQRRSLARQKNLEQPMIVA